MVRTPSNSARAAKSHLRRMVARPTIRLHWVCVCRSLVGPCRRKNSAKESPAPISEKAETDLESHHAAAQGDPTPEEEKMMKTYVIVVNGKPTVLFRANNDTDAAEWVASSPLSAKKAPGDVWTTRLATIPEQAKWRAASVDDENDALDRRMVLL